MPPQSRTRRLSSDGQATLRRLDDAELRRRDVQTEAILARLASPSGADRAPSLRDLLLPRSSEVAAPTDAQRAAHEARVRETQAGWGPVRRRMAQVAEYVPEFLGGALWGDPTAPGASRANLMGQMLTAGIPFASGIKGGLRTGRGLFSRLDDAIDLIPVKGAHPNKVASLLSRASKEELEYRGVPAFLAAQGNTPVTREALRAHLGAHPAPAPEVTTRGLPRIDVRRGRLERMEVTPRLGEPKYSQYQVPGGTNYRETVLTLPGEVDPRLSRFNELDYFRQASHPPTNLLTPAQMDELAELRQLKSSGALGKKVEDFSSPHFDEPNVLVHTRSNERTLPTGERGRFLEEVQSDWHQAGKQRGYQQPGPRGLFGPESQEYREISVIPPETRTPVQATRMDELNALADSRLSGVPDAPFKDSWPDLGFKQQLLEVADDPTLDWIGFTSGKTQTDRWGSERLTWEPVDRLGVTGHRVRFEPQVGGDALGGDMGQQAFDQGLTHTDTAIVRSEEELANLLGGSDVKAAKAWKRIQSAPGGGAYLPRAEGMVEFYDRLLPKRVAKIVKPFGGIVEQVSLGGKAALYRSGQPDQWIVRLTPEMKAKIKQGLPLLALPAGVQVSASRPEED